MLYLLHLHRVGRSLKVKLQTLLLTLINFIVSLGLWLTFDTSTAKFQFVKHIGWLPFLNMNVYIGLDGISLFFIILTTFLVPVCLLVGWVNITKHVKRILYCISTFRNMHVSCILYA